MDSLIAIYKVWPGKNRFYCWGSIITGPADDCCINSCTWISICGITIPYIILITPKLWVDISPALSIPTYVLFISTILFLFLTQCSDPGIIPRKEMILVMNNKELLKYIEEE